MLSLAEEIFLLSLLEKKDTIRIPTALNLPYVLAGAVLLDLVLSGYAKLEDGRLILCVEPEQISNEPMRYAVEKLRQADKPRKLNQWVYLFGSKGKRLSKQIILSFVEYGIISSTGKYYQWGPGHNDGGSEEIPSKYILKRKIRDTVFVEKTISDRCFALLELMATCDMLDHLFTKDEILVVRKDMKRWGSAASASSGNIEFIYQMREAILHAATSAMMN